MTTRSSLRQVYFVIALVLLLQGPLALAQSTYGKISGIVTDAGGAVIAKAQVQITNQSTGISRTVVSDDQGDYTAVNVDAGVYTITVTAAGMVSAVRKDLPLLAREEVRADFQLQVSGVSQLVEVHATEPVVDQSLTISDSKSGNDINSLALNFRATNATSPIVVANLTAGVQPDPSGNISISGGLPNSTSFSIDGISTQQVRFGGPNVDMFPSVESIAEFKINTAANNAEFSQPTDLTVISKSGGNSYHGTGFWFFQRDALNARDPFATIKPSVQADDFGFSLSGPLTIPKVYDGKNKTFFFFTYEGTRRPQDFLLNEVLPPTPWRTGNLSSVKEVFTNPVTGQPFPNNQIPVNPVSAKILSTFFANPNSATNTSIASPNFNANFPGNFTVNDYDGRIDHNFTESQKVYFRISNKEIISSGTDGTGSYNTQLGSDNVDTTLLNLSGSHNWIIKSNLVNEFRAGYTSAEYKFNNYPLAAQGEQIVQGLGITGLPGSPANGLGGVSNFGIASFLGGATSPGHPRDIKNHTLELGDNINWLKGEHSFKFGFEFIRMDYEDQITFLTGDEFGDFFFDGSITAGATGVADSAHAFADFLLGYPVQASFAQNGPDGKPYGYHYGGFAQDQWKFRRNLTLSYGLRYEVNTPFNDSTHQLGQFDRNFPGGRLVVQDPALISPSWRKEVGDTPFVTYQQVGLPSSLRYTYWKNIQPRLGLAWDVTGDGKTVVRGAGGIYSVPVLGAVLYSLLGVDTSNFVEFTSSQQNRLLLPTGVFSGASTSLGFPGYRRANQYDLMDPRVVQWSASVDRDLGHKTLLRLSYTGSKTTGLIYSPDLNQVQPNTVGYAALTATPELRQQNLKFPNFAEVLTRDNGPSAVYNAFSVQFSRRFAGGLTFQNSYTLSYEHTNALGSAPNSDSPNGEGTGSGAVGDNGGNVLNFYNIAADYGNAPFVARHRFVSTFLYDLPFGTGKYFLGNAGRAENLLVGGWKLTGVTILQTGPYLTPTFTGSDPSGTNPSQRSEGAFQRPDCVAGVDPNARVAGSGLFFNPAAFTVPGNDIGRFGSCGVGILEGPGTRTFSMSLGKDFRVGERFSVHYEAQFANLFNITNLGVPNTAITGGGFGQVTSTQPTQEAGARTIQMALRFSF